MMSLSIRSQSMSSPLVALFIGTVLQASLVFSSNPICSHLQKGTLHLWLISATFDDPNTLNLYTSDSQSYYVIPVSNIGSDSLDLKDKVQVKSYRHLKPDGRNSRRIRGIYKVANTSKIGTAGMLVITTIDEIMYNRKAENGHQLWIADHKLDYSIIHDQLDKSVWGYIINKGKF